MDDLPAFPKTAAPYSANQNGMNLRDYFAAKAMQAYLNDPSLARKSIKEHAEAAYQVADAMINARERSND